MQRDHFLYVEGPECPRKAGSELSVRQMALRPINFSNLGDLVHQGKCRPSCSQWRWLRLLIIRVGWRSRLELIPSHRKDAYRGVATVCQGVLLRSGHDSMVRNLNLGKVVASCCQSQVGLCSLIKGTDEHR